MSGVKGRSGGARAGSGPKRLSVRQLDNRGSRYGAALPRPAEPLKAPAEPVVMPESLPEAERAVWARLAPLAIARNTLTAAEVDAFADLCETVVVMNEMLQVIRADGLMQTRLSTKMDADGGGEQIFESKAHPLIQKWTALKVRVESAKARFLLTATGKPILQGEPEAPALSPLERLQAMKRVK